MICRKCSLSFVRVVLVGILLFHSVAFGAAKGGGKNPKTREVPVGVRLPDGNEASFRDCGLLDGAVRKGEISTSSSAGCLGLTPLHVAVASYPDKVASLLEAGANPNAEQRTG